MGALRIGNHVLCLFRVNFDIFLLLLLYMLYLVDVSTFFMTCNPFFLLSFSLGPHLSRCVFDGRKR